jgi:hypothetical protein
MKERYATITLLYSHFSLGGSRIRMGIFKQYKIVRKDRHCASACDSSSDGERDEKCLGTSFSGDKCFRKYDGHRCMSDTSNLNTMICRSTNMMKTKLTNRLLRIICIGYHRQSGGPPEEDSFHLSYCARPSDHFFYQHRSLLTKSLLDAAKVEYTSVKKYAWAIWI